MKTIAKWGTMVGLLAAVLLLAPGVSLAKQDCRQSNKKKHGTKKCIGKEIHQCKKVGKKWRWVKVLTCNHGCKDGTLVDKGKAFCKCNSGQNRTGLYCDGDKMYKCHNSETDPNGGAKTLKFTCMYGCYREQQDTRYCKCTGGRTRGAKWCANGSQYMCNNLSIKARGDQSRVGPCP